MSVHQYAILEDTVYFWFGSNDTSGSGADGATPLCDVREAGATITDAPILSPTPAIISHVNFPAGCHEVAVAATAGNGFAKGKTYAVFCTLTVDSQNPTGFVGSFTIGAAAIAAGVWDRVLTGATHNIGSSAGRRLRQLEAAAVLHEGVAQDGGPNTITLDSGASSIDDFYNHTRIVITDGTGSEQERIIVDYTGSSRVAKIAPPWITEPVNGTTFEVEPGLTHAETGWPTIDVGIAQAGGASTITLDSDASGTNDFYNDDVVIIDAGTGVGQSRVITAYDGTSKIATVDSAWSTNPDSTSEYLIENAHVVTQVISAAALDAIKAKCDTALADYAPALASEVTAARMATLTDWINGGRLDLLLDAIKAVTDVLPNSGALSDLATILADTNELQGDNVPGLIAALNNITAASVWAVATRVLTAFTGLPGSIQKNVALPDFPFVMYNSADSKTPITGRTVTGERSIDGGAFGAVSGSFAEIGSGAYNFDALAADTNGNFIMWRFTASGADDVFISFKTVP